MDAIPFGAAGDCNVIHQERQAFMTSISSTGDRRQARFVPVWPALILLAMIALALLFPSGVFTIDEAIYLEMARAMAETGSLSLAGNGGVEDAPALLRRFTHDVGGQAMPQYPSGYALIAAPFYAAFGLNGLILLNALSACAAVLLTQRLARLLYGDENLAWLAAGLLAGATFMSTYAFGVWPHMLHLALLLSGVERVVCGLQSRQPVMVAAGGAFVVWGVPALAHRAAFMVPAETSEYIGKGTLELLDEAMSQSELLDEDESRLRERFAEITRDAAEGHDFELVFRRGEAFGANALALPSGTIVLTDELVELAEHEDEIVAVLAHEVGHVVHRHGLRHVIQTSALAVAVVLVTGDLSSTSSFVALIPTLLVETSFSREFEREADDYAAAWLHRRAIPTSRLATMLRRLTESHGEGPEIAAYLSTHPTTEERIERLEEL